MMTRLYKLLILLTIISLFAAPSMAQSGYTSVSGIIADSNGTRYINSPYTVTFYDPGTSGKLPLLNGSTFQQSYNGYATDSSGNISISLPDNSVIASTSGATGTQWTFNICTPAGLYTTIYCIPPTRITISGASQSIAAAITAVAPILPLPPVSLGTNNNFTGVNTFVCGPQAGVQPNPSVAYANCAVGIDIGAQINTAEAALPANGGIIYILPGSYNFSTQIIINKTIVLQGLGAGYEQNAGQHASVRLTWTAGAGPVIDCPGTSGIGSRIDGLEMGNSSATLIGFISFEGACGGTIVDHLWIDRPATKALSYCVKVGDPSAGAVNYFEMRNSQLAHCAPTGYWNANVQANAYVDAVWSSQNGYIGTVNTSNGALGACAANCFQLATGANYPSDLSWQGLTVIIGATRYTISALNSATSGTLTSAPGTQNGVAFAFASQATFGSATSPSNIFTSNNSYWKPTRDFGGEALEDALPVVNYINISGAHAHYGDTFEEGGNSGITGYVMETAVAATINGGINCFGCTMNAVIGAGQVSAFVHVNTSTATIQLYGTTFGENAGVPTNPVYMFQNDASANILATGSTGKLTEVLNYATGILATTNGDFISNTNGGVDLKSLFGKTTQFGCLNTNIVATTGDIGLCRKTGGNIGKLFFGTGANTLDYGVTSAGIFTLTGGGLTAPNFTDSALSSGNCVQAGTAGILTGSTGNCVSVGQTNIYGSFLQDFTSATVEIPEAAGFTTNVNSTIGLDTTNNNTHLYTNNADSVAVAEAAPVPANTILKSSSSTNSLATASGITDNGTTVTITENISATKINSTIYVDGVTYPQTMVGIQSALNAQCTAGGGLIWLPGPATYAGTATISLPSACSNVTIAGPPSAVVNFSPTAPFTAGVNDRAFNISNGISGTDNRPITASIAAGATSFVATLAGNTADLVANDWLAIYVKDPGYGEAIRLEYAQVASVAGTTVNLLQPLQSALTIGGAQTIQFERINPFPANITFDGFTMQLTLTGVNTSPTAVVALYPQWARNITIRNMIFNIFPGSNLSFPAEPIAVNRTLGVKIINNKFICQGSSGNTCESEYAATLDAIIDGNTYETASTSNTLITLIIDFGTQRFQFINNHINNSNNFGILTQGNAFNGVIADNIIGLVSGQMKCIALLGSTNVGIHDNVCQGPITASFAGSFGIGLSNDAGATPTLVSAGNEVWNNKIGVALAFAANYSIANVGDGSAIGSLISAPQIQALGTNAATSLDLFDTTPAAASPHKYFRIVNGSLQIVNSAFGAIPFSMTDAGAVVYTGSVTGSGFLPNTAGATDLGSTSLPHGNLWLGTAATNNFKFQPAATAAARVISIPDPLAAENLALIDTMTVNFIPKAASSTTSRLSPSLESDNGTTMTYTGTGGYSAPILTSTVATGTAPLTVTSTTAVANLKVQNLSAVSSGNLPSAAGGTDVGSTALPYGNLWLGTAATNNFKFQPATTSGARIITMADPLSPTTVALPMTIASGTSAMTTAGILTVACGTTVTTAATGVLTTDVIDWSVNAAVTAANNGVLILKAWPTAGNVNFNYCNPTAATQTPTATTVNWSVRRP